MRAVTGRLWLLLIPVLLLTSLAVRPPEMPVLGRAQPQPGSPAFVTAAGLISSADRALPELRPAEEERLAEAQSNMFPSPHGLLAAILAACALALAAARRRRGRHAEIRISRVWLAVIRLIHRTRRKKYLLQSI